MVRFIAAAAFGLTAFVSLASVSSAAPVFGPAQVTIVSNHPG
jgi:hypothetical protein